VLAAFPVLERINQCTPSALACLSKSEARGSAIALMMLKMTTKIMMMMTVMMAGRTKDNKASTRDACNAMRGCEAC